MNFMGGGRRAMKEIEKDIDQNKEKVLNYIQKKMEEKTQLESTGQSIFKANVDQVVNRSQDVIKVKMINKIYSKPPAKQKQSFLIREVAVEKSLTYLSGIRSADRPIFKHHRQSKNWRKCIIKSFRPGRSNDYNLTSPEDENNNLINSQEQSTDNQEERLKMTHEWVTASDNPRNCSQAYIRTYV